MAPTNFPSTSGSKNSLGKSIIRIVFGVALGIGYCYGINSCVNKFLNDREVIGENYYSISRGDGFFGYTQLIRGNLYEEVHKSGLLESETITDNGKDGIVDEITIYNIGLIREVTREKSYEQYKKEFDEADKILADTKKRFNVE
jgi:hypothetical protein